ncbi:hypothetical protein THAOC_34434 [Thalassiosira oceanica]|uniref:Uncharacterized protein n=1 Tax=Thalassiosira oceanica TaxID=159749 RepID=K0R3I1_THAOC|nr:hypothetical protein THAOC_34434 [Thalassiosira oceanica]|eukprot:EJK46880.1 hypothetical protein THAOC_34434 [Thalassiosira oceanica]
MGSLGGEIDNISNLSQPSGLPGGASSVLEPSKDELSTEFLSAEDITIRVKLPDALKGLTTNTTFANDQFKFIADNNPDAAQATIEAVYAFNGSISDNYRDMLIEEKNKHQKSISEAEQSVEDSKGRIEAAKKRVEELKDDAAAGKKSVANDVKRRLRSLEHEYEVRSEEIKAHGEKLKKAYDVDLEGANNQLEMLKKGHSNLEKEVDKRHKIQRETYGLALDHHTLLKTGADLVSKIQKAARANELGADHPLKQYCQHYYRMIGTHNAKVHKIDCGEFNQEAVVGEFNQEAAVEEDDSEL